MSNPLAEVVQLSNGRLALVVAGIPLVVQGDTCVVKLPHHGLLPVTATAHMTFGGKLLKDLPPDSTCFTRDSTWGKEMLEWVAKRINEEAVAAK
jgi:hypothetical protein